MSCDLLKASDRCTRASALPSVKPCIHVLSSVTRDVRGRVGVVRIITVLLLVFYRQSISYVGASGSLSTFVGVHEDASTVIQGLTLGSALARVHRSDALSRSQDTCCISWIIDRAEHRCIDFQYVWKEVDFCATMSFR